MILKSAESPPPRWKGLGLDAPPFACSRSQTGLSGYCECENGRKARRVGCIAHPAFTCVEVCAAATNVEQLGSGGCTLSNGLDPLHTFHTVSVLTNQTQCAAKCGSILDCVGAVWVPHIGGASVCYLMASGNTTITPAQLGQSVNWRYSLGHGSDAQLAAGGTAGGVCLVRRPAKGTPMPTPSTAPTHAKRCSQPRKSGMTGGNDIGGGGTCSSPAACREMCSTTPGCAAWYLTTTWAKNQCFLKSKGAYSSGADWAGLCTSTGMSS